MSANIIGGSKDAAKLTGSKKQTIPNLFSTGQQKSFLRDGHTSESPSPSKKIKLSGDDSKRRQSASCTSAVAAAASFAPLPLQEMFTFPSNATASSSAPQNTCTDKVASGGVIDLTGGDDVTSSSQAQKKMKGCVGNVDGSRSGNREGFFRLQNPNFTPHMGAKKILVKNLRSSGSRSDPRQHFERIWAQLHSALDTIFRGKKVASLEELYRGVLNVCRLGFGAELAERLEGDLEAFASGPLSRDVVTRVETTRSAGGTDEEIGVLWVVIEAWETWKEYMCVVQRIFIYLDRSYLLHSPKPCIDELSTTLFRDYIFKEPSLNQKIIDGACKLIGVDRAGNAMDQTMIRKAVDLFYHLLVYTECFEPRLLEFSQTFVLRWSEQAVAEKSLRDYVASCFELIKSEDKRCVTFDLNSTTRRALMTLIEHHLIERQEPFLVSETAVASLLSENAVEDLGALYKLLEIKGLGAKLKPAFEKWIDSTGTAIVFDEGREGDMVVRLLVLKKQLDRIWRVSFEKHTSLGHCLRETFEAFINRQKKGKATWGTDNSKPEEMIAKHVDLLMRGGTKAIPSSLATFTVDKKGEIDENAEKVAAEEEEVNRQLDQVLDLFRFVQGKAVFEAFYKKDLARRLLMERSASADAERSMLLRLKTECGAGFTQNLETMFKDIDLAAEEMVSYRTYLAEKGEKSPFDFNVNILSTSAWPSYPDIPVIIPPDIQTVHDRFSRHYKSKHGNRKLDWKHALAKCQLRARFPNAMKEIVVSSFQALVLLLFNEVGPNDGLTYESISEMTGLPEPEVKRTLQSLACAHIRPLKKQPKGRDINAGDLFFVNQSFSHPKIHFKINQLQLKETKDENRDTHERVAMDRNYETQAAIVRIIKSRKTITHAELVSEVIKATRSRGVLNVADIKKNIDSLIEKDYMEREEARTLSHGSNALGKMMKFDSILRLFKPRIWLVG